MSKIIKILWQRLDLCLNTLKTKMSTTVTNSLLTKPITFPSDGVSNLFQNHLIDNNFLCIPSL